MVEIDRERAIFSFAFLRPGGVVSYLPGAPWIILSQSGQMPLAIPPRLEAEVLFNKEGLVRGSDEEAARDATEQELVHSATGLVWRQIMLRAFDRAVLDRSAILHARIAAPFAPFTQLPSDVWQVLTIGDWQNGTALDPDGVAYYAIYVRSAPLLASTAAGESAAVRALASQLRSNPELKRDEASQWCTTSGYLLTERGFQQRVWPKAREEAGLPARAPPGRKAGRSFP